DFTPETDWASRVQTASALSRRAPVPDGMAKSDQVFDAVRALVQRGWPCASQEPQVRAGHSAFPQESGRALARATSLPATIHLREGLPSAVPTLLPARPAGNARPRN